MAKRIMVAYNTEGLDAICKGMRLMSMTGPTDKASKDVVPASVTTELDFIGPFKPLAMRTGNRYIIVAIDYCTK